MAQPEHREEHDICIWELVEMLQQYPRQHRARIWWDPKEPGRFAIAEDVLTILVGPCNMASS